MNLLVVPWILQSHNICLTKHSELRCVWESFVQKNGTNRKPNSSTSFTESKMLRTGNCGSVSCAVLIEFQSGPSRVWVLYPNEWLVRAWYVLADFSLQFLEPLIVHAFYGCSPPLLVAVPCLCLLESDSWRLWIKCWCKIIWRQLIHEFPLHQYHSPARVHLKSLWVKPILP